MQNMKKIVLIFIIILSIIIINLSKKIYNELQSEPEEKQYCEYIENAIGDNLEDTKDRQKVLSNSNNKIVQNCVQMLYDTINIKSDEYYDVNNQRNVTDEQINNKIISLLSDEYIKENNINISNIDDFIKKTEQKIYAITLDMEYINTGNIYKYITYGILVNSEYKLIDKYYIYVNIDTINKLFSIEPISEEKYKNGNLIIMNNSIEKKENNTYENVVLGYDGAIKEYINNFRIFTIANLNLSYNFLDNSYKEKKFNNIDKYKKFIENNKDRILHTKVDKYSVKYEDDFIEFICVDEKGFYYIIRQDVNDSLNYKFILDSYTIDMTETMERYDKSIVKEKIAINIGKIIEAINLKDYDYVYSKLDSTFKSKYFDNAELLGDFLQQNMYEINKIIGGKFSENGNDIYTYELKISSYDEEDKETKDLTIIMKLLDNRDFVMSFSL